MFLPAGKADELQILCWRAFAVIHYSCTLSALALKPLGFCNNRGQIMEKGKLEASIPPKWDGKAAERIVDILIDGNR